MKNCFIVFLLSLSALVSCTNFVDEGAGLGGVKTSASQLGFSSSSTVQSLTVTSGEKWTIQTPDWLRVSQISGRGYSWSVSLTSEENYGYNRTGVITLQSPSSSAKVNVSQQGRLGAYVPVSSVSLSPQDLVITEGETRQMTATVYPSNASVKSVRWWTSSASVATVSSSGVVTAVSEGSATITVTTEDGSYTAACRVTVKRRVINVTGVSLNKTSVTLTKGETSQLTATVSPSNATNPSVSWKSSSTTVATVSSSGLVKAVDGGTATITVTTEDGNYTATCKVTVKVPVTGVSLDKTDLSLTEGDTYQLSATVSPSNATNKTVSWKSSATSVATVSSNGLITAIAQGSATITVTTEDGGYSASCRVTVNKKTISVTGVSVSPTSLTLTEGDTYQLSTTVSPSNAMNKNVRWTSNATSVATVSSNGLITAKAQGSATITVTTEDGGYTATCVVTVNVDTRKTDLLNAIKKVENAVAGVCAWDLSKNDSIILIESFRAFAEAREKYLKYTPGSPNLNNLYYTASKTPANVVTSIPFSSLTYETLRKNNGLRYDPVTGEEFQYNSAFVNIANQLFGPKVGELLNKPEVDVVKFKQYFQQYLHPDYSSPAFYYLYRPGYVNGEITTFYILSTGEEYTGP